MGKWTWHNEPRLWEWADPELRVVTDGQTDFWRGTWYGFERHSGHFFGIPVTGDFTFEVRVCADFNTLYDQAGVMLLHSPTCWIKAGVEHTDGHPHISSIVTRSTSDWATSRFEGDAGQFWMRLTRRGDAVRIQYSADGQTWPLLRLCHWPAAASAQIGVMCCSPERAGLEVRFSHWRLGPALNKALHDLT